AAVAGRLLTFARRGDLRAAPVEAAALLRDTAAMLVHTLSAQITVQSEAAADAGWLMADGPQLQTVLVNLAANARDAMPGGGTLTLRAASETVAPGAAHPAGLRPGRYVRLDAADTGEGMDEATLARATEPFFTTKPVNKGTGLGLAMARGFVEQLGGGLAIESAPGRGTAVHLWLPAADPPVPVPPRSAPARVAPGTRVLLVDDEEVVRATLAEELEERGYEIQEAADAAEASALLRSERFDVLVTDYSMPGETGTALIVAARRMRPEMPALLLTGMAAEVALEGEAMSTDAAPTEILAKPARAAEIAARIARLTGSGAVRSREPLA
ncbi:MAG TPA: response regulator, partial [Acetobacteraceae bacterium]|nr:response regulator [Acetobacteraceae bacterium]